MSAYVTISLKEYSELLAAKDVLDALHAAGVDNWDWYSQSLVDAGILDEDEEDL